MTGPGIVLALLIAFQALGALVTIGRVGKPRGPLTPGVAIGTVIISVLLIVGYCYLAAS